MRNKLILLLFLLLLFLPGCWDYVDLTERGIIYAIAIDKEVVKTEHHERESHDITEEEEQERGKEKVRKQYVITIQKIEPTAIAGNEKVQLAKGTKWNMVSTKASTITGAIQELDSRLYRRPFFSHVRVILIGEALARDGITKSLDFFVRHPHIRKGTPVIITKGPAKDVLQLENPLVSFSGLYLSLIPRITERIKKTPELDLGHLSKYVHEQQNFIAPRAVLSNDKTEIKYAGAAVFKKDKMIGWLGERETLDWNLCCENCNQTELLAPYPRGEDKGTFMVKINNKRVFYDFTYQNGKVHAIARIYVIADLLELQCKECKKLDTKETKLMEDSLSRSIEERVMYTCNQIRKKFGCDIYGIGNRIKKFHPDIWKEVENNWDKHFMEMEMKVEVFSSLRTAGIETGATERINTR